MKICFASRYERRNDLNLTEKKKRLLHLVLGIGVSLTVAALGVIFALSCYSIYSSGEAQPYTYESIKEAFSAVSVAVYILLSLGAVLNILLIVFSLPEKKEKGAKNESKNTDRLAARVNIYLLSDSEREEILKERRLRRILGTVNTVLFVLEALLPFIYLLNPNNFLGESINSEVLRGMLVYCLCLVPLLIYEAVYLLLTSRSYKRESEYLKNAIKTHGVTASSESEKPDTFIAKTRHFLTKNQKEITLGVRITFIGCGVLFIVLGILNGGMRDVLIKAINICAECIGLG